MENLESQSALINEDRNRERIDYDVGDNKETNNEDIEEKCEYCD